MALHNNLKLFYLLFFSLLLPCHLAQPEVSPSSEPGSSRSEPVTSPSPGPPSASPPSPGPAPIPSSSPRLVPGPTQGSRPSPGPSPSSRPALGPSLLSGPAPGPSSDNYIDDETDTQQYANSEPPSPSMDPSADAPSDSDSPIQFDFSPTLAPSADVDPQVKKICDSTDYPAICLATVSPYLDGETDIPSVLDVAIQASAQFTKYGQTTAQKLAGNPGNPPQLAAVLNECSDSYGKAVEKFGKASNAIPEHDKSTLNTMLSAIVAFVTDCRDANSEDSQLYGISDRLISMTINCLAISSLME